MKHIRKIYESSVDDFKSDLRMYLSHLTDEGFIIEYTIGANESNLMIRIWKPISLSHNTYNYHNSQNFDWYVIEDEIHRAFSLMSQSYSFDIEFIYTISDSIIGDGYKRTFHTEDKFFNGEMEIWKTKSFMLSLYFNN